MILISGFTPLLTASDFSDSNEFEVDILSGGRGADTFILANDKEGFYKQDSQEVSFNPPEPLDISPKDFVIITDFDSNEGDKLQLSLPSSTTGQFGEELPTYRAYGIKNSTFINSSNQELLSNLNPELYSTAIVFNDFTGTADLAPNDDNVVAVLTGNSNDALVGGGINEAGLDLFTGSDDVIFV
ncbi:MAG: hypothetical protein HC930_08365 [Hydrococcus sp. SU_1_0]|nr:hypothetical protein [Hydrococcus sp. SU_1_0]